MVRIENPTLDRAWARLTELHRAEARTYDQDARRTLQVAIHTLNAAVAAIRQGKPSASQEGLSGWL